MKLIESLSLNSGLKIGDPFLLESYFPCRFEKYLTVHTGGGFESKIYSYYQEVFGLIAEILSQNNIGVVQVGGQNDYHIPGVIDLRGKTTIAQTNYLIKNSQCFLGNDSVCAHIAGWQNVPSVLLFGSTSIQCHSPYWYNLKSYYIQAPTDKPISYMPIEENKVIDKIKPEDVAQKIMQVLDIKWIKPIETLFIGSQYNDLNLECVPDQVITPLYKDAMVIRADYLFEEKNIYMQAAQGKVVILTDNLLKIDILKKLKQNIQSIICKVDGHPEMAQFIVDLRKNGFVAVPYSESQGQDLIKLKEVYMDIGRIITAPRFDKKDIDNSAKISDNTHMRTNSLLLSAGKVYASKYHLDKGLTCSLADTKSIIIDTPEFWGHANKMWVFNEI